MYKVFFLSAAAYDSRIEDSALLGGDGDDGGIQTSVCLFFVLLSSLDS